MSVKIIDLNVNDFGGAENHLMEYKTINCHGKEVIDWKRWREVNKSIPLKRIFEYIKVIVPTIVILQEFELNNSKESYDFIELMDKIGYEIIGNIPKYPVSMTVMFVGKELEYDIVELSDYRNGREYAIKVGEYIICGIHIPPNYDKDYWEKIIEFYEKWSKDSVMLIGDFNTYIEGTDNKKRFNEIIMQGAIDVWIKFENSDSTPTEKKYGGRLDYVIVSPNMYKAVVSMEVNSNIMEENISDHAALIIELK